MTYMDIQIDRFDWQDAVSAALKPIRDAICQPLKDAGYLPFDLTPDEDGWGTHWHLPDEGGQAVLEIVHLDKERTAAKEQIAAYSALLESAGIRHQVYAPGKGGLHPTIPYRWAYIGVELPGLDVPPPPTFTVNLTTEIVKQQH